jgi:hypothetical protein
MSRGNRAVKKIALKTRYLKEELYDVEEAFDRRGWELQRAVIELFTRAGHFEKLGIGGGGESPSQPQQEEKEQEPEAVAASPWQRSLFRKIAAKTHPDALVKQDLSEKEIAERTKMLIDAKQALGSADGAKLIGIAAELDIETDDAPEEEQVASMERLAAELEGRIAKIKRTAAWFWGEGHRREILVHVSSTKGFLNPSIELIDSILAWVDGGFMGGVASVIVKEPEQRRARSTRKVGERPERISRS